LPVGAPIPALGGPIPTIRIHAEDEAEIIQVLSEEMGAIDRICGDKPMMAASLHTDNIPAGTFDQALPPPTTVVIDPEVETNAPYFDLVSDSEAQSGTVMPAFETYSPNTFIASGIPDNDNGAVEYITYPTRPITSDNDNGDPLHLVV